jgi:hypothetical protein
MSASDGIVREAALEAGGAAMLFAQLLDAVEVFVRRFVVVDEAQATALTLWVVHSWAIDAAVVTPYVFVNSAEPESGKTRLLEVLHELVREPLLTMNISDAALFRALDSIKPTLFFDEADAVFGRKARDRGHRDDLYGLVNAGYRRGQHALRMGGGNNTTLERFAVFGPKMLCGLGTLPPTLASRCIRIEMKRRLIDEPVEDFYPSDLADESEQLCTALDEWAQTHLDELRAARPERIEGLRDRTMEVWRPLLAIAERAGDRWATAARRAALGLASSDDDDDLSLGLVLLADCRAVFNGYDLERIATLDLIRYLGALDESPWGEWWTDLNTGEPLKTAPRKLALRLRPYGIRPHAVRVKDRTPRGYRREDFQDAWERFLGGSRPGATSATSATRQSQSQADVAGVAGVADRRDGRPANVCDDCTTPTLCVADGDCQQFLREAEAARTQKRG